MGDDQEQKLRDERYMDEALALAKLAYEQQETPIGAVIVHGDTVIGRGYNLRNTAGNPLRHAEIDAIREAASYLGDWRLEQCTIYVTLEPCPMCAGAIVQARIPRAVIGAMNPKAGCAGSILNLLQDPSFNHQVEVDYGVREMESMQMMKSFFAALRQRHSKEQTEQHREE